jgi:hypothetical protein
MSATAGPAPSLRMPSRGGLLIRLGLSFVVALVIVFCAILPAEFHRDPTGIGKLTGLMALSQPAPVDAPASSDLAPTGAPGAALANPDEATKQAAVAPAAAAGAPARFYKLPFRSDEIKIPLKPDGELEYKVRMQPGGTLIYSWAADHGTVYYDMHGEKPTDPDHAQSYGTGIAATVNGSLIAPFAGIHGWFLQNQEGTPIVVTLKMSGFYELRDPKENR